MEIIPILDYDMYKGTFPIELWSSMEIAWMMQIFDVMKKQLDSNNTLYMFIVLHTTKNKLIKLML